MSADTWADNAPDPLLDDLNAEIEQLRSSWRLVERYCKHYPDDWRLVFRREDEILGVSVPEDVWRAFDFAAVRVEDE